MKIVQIGANTGDDLVFEILNQYKDSLELAVLVEPIPQCIPLLKSRYSEFPQVYIENAAITDIYNCASLPFYYEENSNYEVSSFSKDHILNHGCPENKIRSIDIPTLTVNSLLKKHNIEELDTLFIDSEGFDVPIIRSIDFSLFKIRNIYFESVHTDGTKQCGKRYDELIEFLNNVGYNVDRQDNLNSLAKLID